MWCNERNRLHVGAGVAGALVAALLCTGSAAAAAASASPTLKVSGKASFFAEARATGESFEVRATLSDEVGRPLPGAEIRIRTASPNAAPTLHRCGDPRGEAGAELLLNTDKSGRVCSTVTGMTAGSVELSFHDARGYFERAQRVVRLPEQVATSFEIGFDPPLTTLSLDQPVQELGLVARARGGATPPSAAELVLSLAADGTEQELSRTALDGLGEVHRLSLVSSSFGQPGPARLVASLRTQAGDELAQTSSGVMRSAIVVLSVDKELAAGVEVGSALQIRAASALGPAPSGVIEARSRGLSVAAASVQAGVATLTLPAPPAAQLGGTLTLEYIGPGAGWLSGPAIELPVIAARPGYARYVFWVVAALVAGLAVVLGWRRPPRPRPLPAAPPPRVRASVEVLEAFTDGGGYRGHVRDAHEGTAISPAVVSFIGPGGNRPVLLQVRTATDGSFTGANRTFPAGTLVEVTAPFHATLTAPLPGPGVLELSLVSRRRALVERLVRWAERQGKPWIRPNAEPTPSEVAQVASSEAEPEVERWARRLEQLAFGAVPPDGAAEQASGVAADPKTTRERGID